MELNLPYAGRKGVLVIVIYGLELPNHEMK